MDQHHLMTTSRDATKRAHSCISHFSFETTEAAGWEMDGNGVQLGVVGPHCRFCIKHAGVPRESELNGLIICCVAVVGCRVGQHRAIHSHACTNRAHMHMLACRDNIGSQESSIQMRQSKCLSTNSSSHFGKGGFLTYMCNTLAGLKSTYRMHLGSTPSPSGHVFRHLYLLVQSRLPLSIRTHLIILPP